MLKKEFLKNGEHDNTQSRVITIDVVRCAFNNRLLFNKNKLRDAVFFSI